MSTGTVRHITSRRPAFGVRVVLLSLPDGADDPAQGSFIEETFTDRDGRYTFVSALPANPRVTFWRGQLLLGSGSVGDAVLDLPAHLKGMANLLAPGTYLSRAFRNAAQALLNDILRSQTVASCASKTAALSWPSADGENPGIYLGSLLAACAVQLQFDRVANRQRYGAGPCATLALSILDRFEVLSPSPGYIVRWLQAADETGAPLQENGAPVLIDPCDLKRGDPAVGLNASDTNARAEPTVDEYSGILLGLSWMAQLARDFDTKGSTLLEGLLSDIDGYLKANQYWLIKPCAVPDLTVRGGVSGLASFGYDAAISKALGRPVSDGGHPLTNRGPTLAAATATAEANLEATPDIFAGPHIGQYSGSILVAEAALNFDIAAIGSILVLPLVSVLEAIATPGAVLPIPFGDSLSALPLLPIIVSGVALDVAFTSGNNLWGLFSQFVQWGLSSTPYNNANYDRLALAGSGTHDIEASWQVSASRPRLNSDTYTRSLAIAASLWMGNVAGSFDVASDLLSEMMAQMQDSTLGGYTRGDRLASYCIICLVLDIDPGLDWSRGDLAYLDPLLLS